MVHASRAGPAAGVGPLGLVGLDEPAAKQLQGAGAHAKSRGKAQDAAAVHRGAGRQKVAVEAAEVVVVVVVVPCGHTQ